MRDVYHLFYDAMSSIGCPESSADMPIFDDSIHTMLGTLPYELRRAFDLFQNLAENPPRDAEERKVFDSDLSVGHDLLHKGVAGFFNIKPLTDVVICQGWVVAIVKSSEAVSTPTPPQCPSIATPLNHCLDLASY